MYQTAALSGKRRTAEIERFLYYHKDIKEYIVIDDDEGEYEKPMDGLYLVNRKIGITDRDLKKMRYVSVDILAERQ